MVIIVKPNFQQTADCKILGYLGELVEIEIGSESSSLYNDYIVLLSDEELYTLKLERCIYLRVQEYKKLNQFDLQYDDTVNGTTKWKDAVTAIKTKFPKPLKPIA